MRQLPLFTILLLVVGILAWNFSFYGEFYRARSSALPVRAEGRSGQVRSVEPGELGDPNLVSQAGHGDLVGSEGDPSQVPQAGSDQRAPADAGADLEVVPVEHTYPDGGDKSVGSLLNGRRHGSWTEYWENGRRLMVGKFVDGERDGSWQFFHEGGELRSEGKYEAGLKVDRWESYHANGQRRSTGEYSADERAGLWSQYYTDGSLMSQGKYERGVMQGHWEFREPEGRIGQRTGEYLDGAQVRD